MKEQILIIMSEVFELDILDLPNEVNQEQIDNWDSLRHLNLIVELEEAFDVSFEPEEISEMISIEKIEQVIMEKYHDK